MALDGPNEEDKTFEEKGLTFVINTDLYEKVKPVTVEFVSTPMGAGFKIASNLATSAGGCGTSCDTNSSCNCG